MKKYYLANTEFSTINLDIEVKSKEQILELLKLYNNRYNAYCVYANNKYITTVPYIFPLTKDIIKKCGIKLN